MIRINRQPSKLIFMAVVMYICIKGLLLKETLQEWWIVSEDSVVLSNPSWQERFLKYAKTKRYCFTDGYDTMDKEFEFYKEYLKKRPNLYQEMIDIWNNRSNDQKMYKVIYRIDVKDGKVVSEQCRDCGWQLWLAAKSHGLDPIREFLHHFDNLTFFVHPGDRSKTNLLRNMEYPLKTPEFHCTKEAVQWYYREHIYMISKSVQALVQDPYPIISPAKMPGCHGDLLAPTFYEGMDRKKCTNLVPWQRKEKKLFWRGSDTGGGPEVSGNKTGLRARVMNAVRRLSYPPVDVEFTMISATRCADKCRKHKTKTGLGYCMQQKYAYLLDMDGNAHSRRFPTLLTQGSCVVRFNQYRMWVDDFLVPGRHYVKMPWKALNNSRILHENFPNPKMAKRIAEEGTKRSLYLQEDGAKCYFFRLLLRYADLFNLPLRPVPL